MSKVRLKAGEAEKFKRWTEKLSEENTVECRKLIVATALNVERRAKMFAPVDKGFLRGSIRPRFSKGEMSAVVYANRNYAPYVEFGTGTGVVAPDDVKEYAMEFKGEGKRKVNSRAQPFLFPALRISVKEMYQKLENMGFEKK
jgi:hypothetical protein